MRIAIISDIHGNLPALASVREEIDKTSPDLVACAGDIVGYGGSPNECCRVAADWISCSCMGNHDFAALRGEPRGMNPYAWRALMWTSEHLDEASRRYLGHLEDRARVRAESTECLVHHGSPRDIWEYVFADDATEEMLDDSRASVLILGHTHVPFVKRFSNGLIINPGSVGQPRDGDPRASYSMLSTEPLRCEHLRVEYDIEEAAEAIRRARLPEMLAQRLFEGY